MKITYTLILLMFSIFAVNGQIVITEIMYNPPESGTDSLEYIEIYNVSNSDVNLNGWQFSAGINHTFGETTISAGEYLVVCVDSAVMRRNLGVIGIQWESGGLSNGGESVTLENDGGSIVSTVEYDDGNGWPSTDDGTDGEGSSIELCDPSTDISDPANWKASQNDLGIMINGRVVRGTPGAESTSACPSNADVVVEVSSFEFTPRDITINKGETVRWENKGGTHNVNGQQSTFPDNPDSFSSGNPSGQAWVYEYTFDIPGFYDYQCDPHVAQDMIGTITVLDPADVLPKLVITEIMYNDPAMTDSLEFIELYNNDQNAIDLAGFSFDSGPQFTFPNMMLPAGDFMIIAQDSAAFKRNFGMDVFQYESGGLASDGAVILIVNSLGDTIDVVSYSDRDPWPTLADGQGYSLILCDPDADNSLAENWGVATLPAGFQYEGLNIFADPGSLSYCLVTIAEASMTDVDGVATMEGNRVAIQGLTYGGNFRPGGLQFTLIDDVGDGMGVLSLSEDYGYSVNDGDELRVYGNIDQFNGLIQIETDTLIIISQGNEIMGPTVVTALGEDTESQLVTLEDLTLVDPDDWGGAGSGFNVDMTNGTDVFTIRIDADVDLFTTAYPTGTFSVTGIGGQFDSSSPYNSGYQLIPRSSADIDPFVPFEEMFPERTIVEMSTVDDQGVADSLGMSCTLTGKVYGINLRPSGLQFTIIDDENNGIGVFNSSGDLGYTFNQGDVITLKGVIDQFSGLTQIEPEEITVESIGGNLLDPMVVTTLNESTESSYIKMDNMTYVDPSDWAGDGSSFNVDIMDGDGNVFVMRIDNDSELSTMAAPEAPFNVIGIGGQFDSNEPFDEGYQIFPFFVSDFSSSSSLDEILDESTIRVYPNPVESRLILESEEVILNVEVFDVRGSLLIQSQQSTVDMSELNEGIYYVRIETREGGIIRKVVKK